MTSRIGTLHLDYKANARDRAAAAMAPHLDRLLASRLGEALDARLHAFLGDDQEVLVIKDVRARTSIRATDLALDSRILDAVGRSTVDAITAQLTAPAAEDQIVRFTDQAEFIGSFIVDLLRGSAWDRWYFGAFVRYRRTDDGETIGAVLDDHREFAVAVFGWLARRGHLDAVLALVGHERANLLAMQRDPAQPATDARGEVAPLFAAAFRLLASMGWHLGDDAGRARLTTAYLEAPPLPPTWTDRRSLTAWILRFVHFAIADMARRQTAPPTSPSEVRELLRGDLDWLDGEWLAPQLEHLSTPDQRRSPRAIPPARRILTVRHEQALTRIAELVRLGRVRLSPTDDANVISVRLMAALADVGAAASRPDRAFAQAIERIARALRAAQLTGLAPQRLLQLIEGSVAGTSVTPFVPLDVPDIDGVRDMGPAAQEVLRRLVVATVGRDAGERTVAAPLFLLTRAMIDVKLHVLAREAGVPFESVKVALAAHWLNLSPPFDAATALWIGRPAEHLMPIAQCDDELSALAVLLGSLLQQQRAIDVVASADATAVGQIGWMVLRAWSRWLPGIANASPDFLLRNCLCRAARAHVTTTAIELQIDAAPLDVVLDMSGYFAPIPRVPWLDGRTVTFTKRRGV